MEETLHTFPKDIGWIEVICGCMFSGKTEELIRRVRRAQIAKQKVMIFKPKIDDRFSKDSVVTHNDQSFQSTIVEDAGAIPALAADAQVIGIDESQFFQENLIQVCEELANDGKRVIVAGLDQDYRGRPFDPMPQLLTVAEYIVKTLAICVVCGNPADRTQRKTNIHTERIAVGASEMYEARCRKCFVPPSD